MRPLPFILFAYVAVAMQVGLAPYVRVGPVGINLVLVAVVFLVLHAPREAALTGAFVLGLMQDLVSSQPLGTWAFIYAFAALVCIGTQRIVHGSHPLTHLAVALMVGVIAAVVLAIQGWLRPDVRVPVGVALGSAVLTAVVAPAVLWFCERLTGLFGFQQTRRTGRPGALRIR